VRGSYTRTEGLSFHSKEGGFSIEFPAKPRDTFVVVNMKKVHLHIITRADFPVDDNLFYAISVTNFGIKKNENPDTSVKEFFQGAVDAILENGSIIHSQTEIHLKKYPGMRLIAGSADGTQITRLDCYQIKNHAIFITVRSKRNRGITPSMDKFFNSFTLL
jgi:hypothetical protein